MPTVSETRWGHWGIPSPTKAWGERTPALHGETGGALKPGYAKTLKWYYKHAKNSEDKEKCLQLLTQLELQKQISPKRSQSILKHTGGSRPASAQKHDKSTKPLGLPQTSSCVVTKSDSRKAYEKQLAAAQRLSRPKAVGYRFATPTPQRKPSMDQLRPKSAMEARHMRTLDPYLTTHELDFPGYPSNLYAEAVRPMTAKGVINPPVSNGPVEMTTFEEQFPWKTAPQVLPIRSGTSSGSRGNKPHPDDAFMNWKLPKKNAKGANSAPAKNLGFRELRNEVLDQIIKDKMKSTYQGDFLGIPQGYQVKEAIDCPFDWRDHVHRPKDTTTRRIFDFPKQEPELVGNTARYGCNKNKGAFAYGAVPTVTKDHVAAQEMLQGNTTYRVAFQDNYNQPSLRKVLQQQQSSHKEFDRFLRFSRRPSKNII